MRLPAINLTVFAANGTTKVGGATVIVKTADTGCTQTFPTQTTLTTPAASVGMLSFPGHPYGKYTICAYSGTNYGRADVRTSTGFDAKQTTTVVNEAPPATGTNNKVDDTVVNTAAAGNSITQTTTGAIKIQLNRKTATGAVCP